MKVSIASQNPDVKEGMSEEDMARTFCKNGTIRDCSTFSGLMDGDIFCVVRNAFNQISKAQLCNL